MKIKLVGVDKYEFSSVMYEAVPRTEGGQPVYNPDPMHEYLIQYTISDTDNHDQEPTKVMAVYAKNEIDAIPRALEAIEKRHRIKAQDKNKHREFQ